MKSLCVIHHFCDERKRQLSSTLAFGLITPQYLQGCVTSLLEIVTQLIPLKAKHLRVKALGGVLKFSFCALVS